MPVVACGVPDPAGAASAPTDPTNISATHIAGGFLIAAPLGEAGIAPCPSRASNGPKREFRNMPLQENFFCPDPIAARLEKCGNRLFKTFLSSQPQDCVSQTKGDGIGALHAFSLPDAKPPCRFRESAEIWDLIECDGQARSSQREKKKREAKRFLSPAGWIRDYSISYISLTCRAQSAERRMRPYDAHNATTCQPILQTFIQAPHGAQQARETRKSRLETHHRGGGQNVCVPTRERSSGGGATPPRGTTTNPDAASRTHRWFAKLALGVTSVPGGISL